MPTYAAVRDSYSPQPDRRPLVRTPEDVAKLLKPLVRRKREHMVVLLMDAVGRLTRTETVAVGSLNVARATPRDILAPALKHDSAGIVLVHNHPSGSAEPSEDDVQFTRALDRAAVLMGIPLWDHIVIAQDGYVSLRFRGVVQGERS